MRYARLATSSFLVLAVAAPVAVMGGCGASSSDQGSPGKRGASSSSAPAAPVGASAQRCAGAVAGVEGLRVSGAGCAVGRGIVASWADTRRCSDPAGASRFSCPIAGYRCLGTATDRGIAVTCAGPGRSISFITRRG
jgi:hypothetical protein